MEGNNKKELFCGDTFNTLEENDKEFDWSKSYNWYLDLRAKEKASMHIRTIGVVKSIAFHKFMLFQSWYPSVQREQLKLVIALFLLFV